MIDKSLGTGHTPNGPAPLVTPDEQIVANREKAREQLARQARTGERFSIPMPGQEPLITNDTAKLLASQNEAQRIVRKLERMDNASGPFPTDKTAVLRNEYQRGLEVRRW